jgi:hypothetical protein
MAGKTKINLADTVTGIVQIGKREGADEAQIFMFPLGGSREIAFYGSLLTGRWANRYGFVPLVETTLPPMTSARTQIDPSQPGLVWFGQDGFSFRLPPEADRWEEIARHSGRVVVVLASQPVVEMSDGSLGWDKDDLNWGISEFTCLGRSKCET